MACFNLNEWWTRSIIFPNIVCLENVVWPFKLLENVYKYPPFPNFFGIVNLFPLFSLMSCDSNNRNGILIFSFSLQFSIMNLVNFYFSVSILVNIVLCKRDWCISLLAWVQIWRLFCEKRIYSNSIYKKIINELNFKFCLHRFWLFIVLW